GNVAIADVDQVSFQGKLDIDIVDAQEPQGGSAQDSAPDATFIGGRLQGNRDHIGGAARGLFLLDLTNVDSAFVSDGCGVHDVRSLGHALVENALNGRVADQFRVPVAEPSAIAQGDLLDRAGAGNDVGQECAEPLGKGYVGAHLRVLL